MARRQSYRLPKIPEMTVRRLSVYTRCLQQLEEDGVKTVSSQELAERFNLNSAQVRKDLAYFGEFGVRGIGYYVAGLKAELQKILGLDREWAVALVGFGNLGSALFHYKGFARQGFRIAAIFDEDPAKIGRYVGGVPVLPSRDLPRELKARGIQIAIVAVPPEAAQAVTDQWAGPGARPISTSPPPPCAPPPAPAPPPPRPPRHPPQARRPQHRARDALVLPGQGITLTARRAALLALALVLLSGPAWVGAAPSIRVGTYANAPLVFRDAEGRTRGIYVDVLEHIAHQEGWTVEYLDGTW